MYKHNDIFFRHNNANTHKVGNCYFAQFFLSFLVKLKSFSDNLIEGLIIAAEVTLFLNFRWKWIFLKKIENHPTHWSKSCVTKVCKWNIWDVQLMFLVELIFMGGGFFLEPLSDGSKLNSKIGWFLWREPCSWWKAWLPQWPDK